MAFCVWALCRDGLWVPPFDRHPNGDGPLRRAGLTPDTWFGWFASVVRRDATARERHRAASAERLEAILEEKGGLPTPSELSGLRMRAPFEHRSAPEMWIGPMAVHERLVELQGEHLESRQRRDRALTEPFTAAVREHDEGTTDPSRHLWNEIQRYRPLPSLYFYVVDYPEPALAVLPPASAVIGGVHPMATGEPYDSLVLEAARRLSA